jgi:hypothetical protein
MCWNGLCRALQQQVIAAVAVISSAEAQQPTREPEVHGMHPAARVMCAAV